MHGSSFGFAGVLPLQKGFSVLEELISLMLVLGPNTLVPLLSEEVLGWLAEIVSHKWKKLPSGNPTNNIQML